MTLTVIEARCSADAKREFALIRQHVVGLLPEADRFTGDGTDGCDSGDPPVDIWTPAGGPGATFENLARAGWLPTVPDGIEGREITGRQKTIDGHRFEVRYLHDDGDFEAEVID